MVFRRVETNNRIQVKVPTVALKKLNFKLDTHLRDWQDIEEEAVRRMGGIYAGGKSACDGHTRSAYEIKGIGKVRKGACLEVKAHKGPQFQGGNWRLWTSNFQLNDVANSGGIFVVVHMRTGNVYGIRGTVVKEYQHD